MQSEFILEEEIAANLVLLREGFNEVREAHSAFLCVLGVRDLLANNSPMDRAFTFFDHPSLLRPQNGGNQTNPNPVVNQSTLLPHQIPQDNPGGAPKIPFQSHAHLRRQGPAAHPSLQHHVQTHQSNPRTHQQERVEVTQRRTSSGHSRANSHSQHIGHVQSAESHPSEHIMRANGLSSPMVTSSLQSKLPHQEHAQRNALNIYHMHHGPQQADLPSNFSPPLSSSNHHGGMPPIHFTPSQSQLTGIGIAPSSTASGYIPGSGIVSSSPQLVPGSSRAVHSQPAFPIAGNNYQAHGGFPPNSQGVFTSSNHTNTQAVMQTSHHPPQPTSFGTLINLSGPVVSNNIEEAQGTGHQFPSHQAVETLSNAYAWEPGHAPSMNSQQVHTGQTQSMLPLIGSTRTTNNSCSVPNGSNGGAYVGSNSSTQHGVVTSGASYASAGGANISSSHGMENTGQGGGLYPTSTLDFGRKIPDSSLVTDEGRSGRTVRKGRADGGRKKVAEKDKSVQGSHRLEGQIGQVGNGYPLPGLKHTSFRANRHPMNNRGQHVETTNDFKMTGKDNVGSGLVDGTEMGCITASSAVSLRSTQNTSRVNAMQILSGSAPVRTILRPNEISASNKTKGSSGWSAKRATSSKGKIRRSKNGDKPTGTPIPVHLRNPKKGRDRVFRECPSCGAENHIRRSKCVACKEPLPAGKRRRDGNPLYDKKNTLSRPAPGTQVTSQRLERPHQPVKEEM